MRKVLLFPLLALSLASITSCGSSKKIVVGATPAPHAQILNSEAVQNYVKEKGYELEVRVYQDYVTPNKALDDGGIDANYFQHIPYLEEEVSTKNYKISAAITVHYEPLNLYSKTAVTDFSNKTISIIKDVSNATRALELLKVNNIIDSYDVTNFNAQHPVYTSSIGVTIECIDEGLLTNKVNDDGLAVIPGNFALNAWGSEVATSYKQIGETEEVASPKANVIACRTSDLKSEKINILCEALAQDAVKTFIEKEYGVTVVYNYKDLRK
ncbi:MAG: MetQ/NlpA family ABC transporter substrate-binding protein [Bacilli bacterium]|nr:MetQ/NlpA family ABC transporter substrate-binding protein [Bacilli bacterium]